MRAIGLRQSEGVFGKFGIGQHPAALPEALLVSRIPDFAGLAGGEVGAADGMMRPVPYAPPPYAPAPPTPAPAAANPAASASAASASASSGRVRRRRSKRQTENENSAQQREG